ncbi:hypothetical protein F2Q69_00058440 [Brassica cretica]|uniref:Uncharacterized protein n=1 Tax=Brassica cretica TaxID=69181 RepID=A0A8S9RMZ9_BRACR|nr:hypothetical protein F2Q69_00058440 [Brassica cretica]
MKLDGVYYPLNDSISWLTTCTEEMRQDIARIQRATDVSRPTSIDRRRHASIDSRLPASIDNRLPASVDDNPPHSHTMRSQPDFHTREEIDQLVEEIYRALKTTEERLDERCDDIYFLMDLTISSLTSKIVSHRSEASALIDRRKNKLTDIHQLISVDDATNRGRLVQKVTSDMSDTHNHGEDISTDTYARLIRHQFNLDNLGDRLQKIEDATTIMKDKWPEEMKQCETSLGLVIMGSDSSNKYGRIQRATDVSRPTSIDRRRHASIDSRLPASIDNRLPASVDDNPPHSHTMRSQSDFHTREEIDQLVEEIYRALKTTKERLDERCDDIYFPMDLTISSLTSKIVSASIRSFRIDRQTKKQIDRHSSTDIADTYARLIRHQFNLDNLGDRLQKIKDATTIMKDKWPEEMKQCETSLEPKLTSNTKLDTTACLGAWYTWDRILHTSLEGKALCR